MKARKVTAIYHPAEYVEFAKQWHSLGATIIGGCCGIGPEFIAALVKWKSDIKEL